ncbi:MAG: nicotinate-nucleotide adenylyltransferase [Candidatus Omnitrophica bacterium]|nr:nicotinate-nucleotide adenylyltransferase [Candidatus Omnitrophota bacterium]
MRIGILGGTFNPVHNGHIKVVEEAKKQLGLERIIFMPVQIPPHKPKGALASAEDRFKMIELAISNIPNVEVSRYEIDKNKTSYSIETVEFLKGSCAEDAELFFLIGQDMLGGLDTWKDIDKLLKLCRFVVFNRPGFEKEPLPEGIERIDMLPVDISSTKIRERVKRQEPIAGLVPEAVEEYISKNNLYKQAG